MNKNTRDYFSDQGYVIFRKLLAPQELDALRNDTDHAVRNKVLPMRFDPVGEEVLAAVPEIYRTADGKVFKRLEQVFQRGGAFARVIQGPLARAVSQVASTPLQLCLNRHNMVMLKAPRNSTPVEWHQDATVWDEGVFAHISAIVAMDDFRADNGCLEVVPESHHHGPIRRGGGWEEHCKEIRGRYDELVGDKAVPVDLKAGDAVAFHGLLLHGSTGNQSAFSRRSLTVAFFPGDLPAISTATEERKPRVFALSF